MGEDRRPPSRHPDRRGNKARPRPRPRRDGPPTGTGTRGRPQARSAIDRGAKLAQHRFGVRPLHQIETGISRDRPFRVQHRVKLHDAVGLHPFQRVGRQVNRQRQKATPKAHHLDPKPVRAARPRRRAARLPQDQGAAGAIVPQGRIRAQPVGAGGRRHGGRRDPAPQQARAPMPFGAGGQVGVRQGDRPQRSGVGALDEPPQLPMQGLRPVAQVGVHRTGLHSCLSASRAQSTGLDPRPRISARRFMPTPVRRFRREYRATLARTSISRPVRPAARRRRNRHP